MSIRVLVKEVYPIMNIKHECRDIWEKYFLTLFIFQNIETHVIFKTPPMPTNETASLK